MKWTPETIAAVNWKEKSAYETLCACVEHWEENERAKEPLAGAKTCAACQKWGVFKGVTVVNHGDCPLCINNMCCGGVYTQYIFNYSTASSVTAVIRKVRDQYAPKEPKYEWADDTHNWTISFTGTCVEARNKEHGCVMHVAPRDLCGMGTLYSGYRMVDDLETESFRIERRIEKPKFKLGAKVKWDGRMWTIVGFDTCTPPCALLFGSTFQYGSSGALTLSSGAAVPGYPRAHTFIDTSLLEAV